MWNIRNAGIVVWTLAGQTLRSAVRSRVVTLLLAILLAGVVLIPLTIEGDGTAAGYVQILLTYTMGFAVLILSVATLWAGCAVVSAEIQNRRLQMVAVKPVSCAQIWLGKWLGLFALNAILLLASGATAAVLLRVRLAAADLPPAECARLRDEILVARHAMSAVRGATGLVAAGQTMGWDFCLPDDPHVATRPLAVDYRLSTSRLEVLRVAARWRLLDETGRVLFDATQISSPDMPQSLILPVRATPGARLRLEYVNTHPLPLTVVFAPGGEPRLLAYAGGFTANLLRALGVLLAHLGLLAAVGVTAGCLFSMPVAVFATGLVLVVLAAMDLIHGMAHEVTAVPGMMHGASALWWNEALRWFYLALNALLQPLKLPDVLAAVARGIRVAPALVLRALAVHLGVYGALTALLGAGLLRRRELAMAERES